MTTTEKIKVMEAKTTEKIKVMEAKTTEKIKVKINVAPKYKEVEVSFPYYVKDGCVLIKFFDREKGIMVADYGFSKQIQYMDMPEDWIAFEPTTEAVFNEAFDKVMNNLIKMNNEKDI